MVSTIITSGPVELVTVALREVGVKEATQQNDGTPSRRYQADPYKPGTWRTVPWCSYFVLWVFDQVEDGPRLHHTRKMWWQFGSVRNLYEHWAPCAISENTDPMPGDLIVLNDRGQSDAPGASGGWHIGIVVAVTEDRILSVDGNWRHQVDTVVRVRSSGQIVDFLRVR